MNNIPELVLKRILDPLDLYLEVTKLPDDDNPTNSDMYLVMLRKHNDNRTFYWFDPVGVITPNSHKTLSSVESFKYERIVIKLEKDEPLNYDVIYHQLIDFIYNNKCWYIKSDPIKELPEYGEEVYDISIYSGKVIYEIPPFEDIYELNIKLDMLGQYEET